MEERIIDDEYARGIRLKKTKDGYVDVTDELSEEAKETPPETEEDSVLEGELTESLEDPEAEPEEEVSFEFPELEEDDEDLVNLTPEEAIALRKKKEAEEAARRAEYKRLCEEGEELLLSGSFKAAELKFEKALPLDEEAADAAVGYWRARTSDFSEPDILAEEYAETGYESLENDLGDGAVEKLKANYRGMFEKRIAELEAEEGPLAKEVESKQKKRRAILKARISSALKKVIGTGIPFLVFVVCTAVFGLRINTRPDMLFPVLTAVFGVLAVGCFVSFGIFTNKLVNARRINRDNEDLSSTEDGERLLKIRAYRELYSHFVD